MNEEQRKRYNQLQRMRDSKNIEHIRKQCKEYYYKNREKYLAQCKKYEEEYPEKRKQRTRKSYLNRIEQIRISDTSPRVRFSTGKYSAKEKNRVWTIQLTQYEKLLQEGCHYCNKSLSNEKGHSLDRIDNSKGYEISNVLPCCGFCNYLRGCNLTVDETKIVIETLIKYRRDKI